MAIRLVHTCAVLMLETDKYVGSRVRMRRLMLHMSQERLADQLGLTFQQVQKYEKGTNRISASRLQEISQILEVPVPFFFEGAPQSFGGSRKSGDGPSLAAWHAGWNPILRSPRKSCVSAGMYRL